MRQQHNHQTNNRYGKFITELEDGVAEYDRLMRAGKAPGQKVRARMCAIRYASAAACIIGFTLFLCLMQPAGSDESAKSVIAVTSNNKNNNKGDVRPSAEKTLAYKSEANNQERSSVSDKMLEDRSSRASDKMLTQRQARHNHTRQRHGSSHKAHMLPEIVITDTPDMTFFQVSEEQLREDTYAVHAYQFPDIDSDGNNQWAENTQERPVEVFAYSQPYGKDV
ncbi:MAG: hypothetical protein MSH51_00540 [Prevotella sp.]|nr:hypothetical protein [Prevotella sp.]MCI7340528.1 hypothetical protein [Prevotella sp.]